MSARLSVRGIDLHKVAVRDAADVARCEVCEAPGQVGVLTASLNLVIACKEHGRDFLRCAAPPVFSWWELR